MKAFAYIRVSGKAQLDGDGPERQREKIAAFCANHGLEETAEYLEEGVSGTVEAMDRPAFVEMLAAIGAEDRRWVAEHKANGDLVKYPGMEQERFNQMPCIVVERMDRLARTLVVQEVLLAECKKRGIKVFSADRGELVDQANDGADPSVVLIRQILGAVAQWEKSVIVMKLKAAKDRMRRETGRCEGPKPYGQNPAEREILQIINMRVWGESSLKSIAESLNARGYKTRSGKPWNKARVFHVYNKQKVKA